jgi:hypothetical protein
MSDTPWQAPRASSIVPLLLHPSTLLLVAANSIPVMHLSLDLGQWSKRVQAMRSGTMR